MRQVPEIAHFFADFSPPLMHTYLLIDSKTIQMIFDPG